MKSRRICVNFPKFPVVFLQGVIEALSRVGDRVHYARETIGTVESFDGWQLVQLFIQFIQ